MLPSELLGRMRVLAVYFSILTYIGCNAQSRIVLWKDSAHTQKSIEYIPDDFLCGHSSTVNFVGEKYIFQDSIKVYSGKLIHYYDEDTVIWGQETYRRGRQIESIENYKSGRIRLHYYRKPDKDIASYRSETYFENGNLKQMYDMYEVVLETEHRDSLIIRRGANMRYGNSYEYYENGKLKDITFYIRNKKSGWAYHFNEDGKCIEEILYLDGEEKKKKIIR